MGAYTGNDGTAVAGALPIGQEASTGGNYFAGHADDLALWNRALSNPEVACIYQKGQRGVGSGWKASSLDLLA